MTADDAIGQLGRKLGFELQLDRKRVCAVVFDDTLTVEFESPISPAHTLVMTCRVAGTVPAEQREEAFALLLQANLFGRGTAGASLAIDKARDEVVLQRTLLLDQVDFQDLLNALELLLQYARAWVDRLKTFNAALAPRVEGSLGAYSSMLKV